MPKKPRSLTFHARLLKKGVTSYDQALKDPNIEPTPLKDDLPFNATLILKPINQKIEPWWVPFLSASTASPLTDVTNISSGAVLFIAVEDRLFALTFGYGHALLKLGSYEPRFGLRVVLNSINTDRLQSLDRRTIDDVPSLTRKQVSQLSPLESFGVDIETDVLKAVAGIPEDKSFANRLSGSDALTIAKAISLDKLGDLCSELLKAYESDEYKKNPRWEWIDHLEDVREPNLIGDLDDLLLEAIANKILDGLHLAAPEIVDWDNALKFRYSHEGKAISHDDLGIEEFVESLDDPMDVDIQFLKSRSVLVTMAIDGQEVDKWWIYDCLVFETELSGSRFILTDGKWYRVSPDFVKIVRDYVAALSVSQLALPSPEPDEPEEDYNERASKGSTDFLLMDDKKVYHGGGSSSIEFCDILTRQLQFVHVKKRIASSKMSHLLAQGSVSAQAFLGDDEFRKKARARVSSEDKSFRDIVPLKRPRAEDYEVVYVFIGGKYTDPLSLPFFTLLHLRQHAKLLKTLGYKVAIKVIPSA